MSVFKRKTKYGETKEYHYKFMQSGKIYYGVCEGCTTERDALCFERNIKATVKRLAEQKSVGALVENFKRELIGGNTVSLNDAFALYVQKPTRRKRSEKQLLAKQAYWMDFCSFLHEQNPELLNLDKVTRQHAESYIHYLRNNGRYVREIKNGTKTAYVAVPKLSNATINVYHKTLRSVFSKLKEDAGLLINPFDFEFLDKESSTRDPFSPEELQLIAENFNDFVKPIFIIGICTGLSEGDICLLSWNEIQGNWISRLRKKTKVMLEIPILPPLQKFLSEQRLISGDNQYVLPLHAHMYLNNPSGISYRFKKFLEGIGIATTRRIQGRCRAASVKDVHSLRHTFAYMAGVYNIPLPVVQGILGHMSPEMTTHYQAHATREAKERYLAKMPNFFQVEVPNEPGLLVNGYVEQEELNKLLSTMHPEKLKQVLAFAKSLH